MGGAVVRVATATPRYSIRFWISSGFAQRQLRHADAAFTVEVYGHVMGDDHTEAMDNLESVLLGPSGS
jgi:integrase